MLKGLFSAIDILGGLLDYRRGALSLSLQARENFLKLSGIELQSLRKVDLRAVLHTLVLDLFTGIILQKQCFKLNRILYKT